MADHFQTKGLDLCGYFASSCWWPSADRWPL